MWASRMDEMKRSLVELCSEVLEPIELLDGCERIKVMLPMMNERAEERDIGSIIPRFANAVRPSCSCEPVL